MLVLIITCLIAGLGTINVTNLSTNITSNDGQIQIQTSNFNFLNQLPAYEELHF